MIACAVMKTDESNGTGMRGSKEEAAVSAERALSKTSTDELLLELSGMTRVQL
jgi:hypothetical protein